MYTKLKIFLSCAARHCHVTDIITIYLSLYYNLPHVFYYNLRQSLLHFTAFLLQFTTVLHFTVILLQFTALVTIYRVHYNLRRNIIGLRL